MQVLHGSRLGLYAPIHLVERREYTFQYVYLRLSIAFALVLYAHSPYLYRKDPL